MRACTMANGAVFFIEDEIERKTKSVKYAELVATETSKPKKMSLYDRLMKRDRILAQQNKAA
jgi:hypothetical protein